MYNFAGITATRKSALVSEKEKMITVFISETRVVLTTRVRLTSLTVNCANHALIVRLSKPPTLKSV